MSGGQRLSGSRQSAFNATFTATLGGGDPNVALRVVNQESGFNIGAQNLSSKEQSYGVMQLNTMGGLGVDALKAGIDVRDPSTWRSQVDFGLDTVKRDGWRQWYAAVAASSGQPVVNVQVMNNAGAMVRTKSSRGSDGQIDLKVLIDQQVASAMSRSGSATNKQMQAGWGLQPQLAKRG